MKLPPNPSSRDEVPPRLADLPLISRTTKLLAALSLAAGAAVLFCFNPSQYHFYPLCQFHAATGLACPGCGALRAAHQLLHLHLVAAMRFNALLVLSVPVAAWLAARFAVRSWQRRPIALPNQPAWLWAGLTVVIAFGILRNLPLPQLAWLSP